MADYCESHSFQGIGDEPCPYCERDLARAEIELAQSKLDAIQKFIDAQAEDPALWGECAYISEHYMQKALRGLHAYAESVIKDGPRPELTKDSRPSNVEVAAELQAIVDAAESETDSHDV